MLLVICTLPLQVCMATKHVKQSCRVYIVFVLVGEVENYLVRHTFDYILTLPLKEL